MIALTARIRNLDPCFEAIRWLEIQPDPETAWSVCHRADWMLWLTERLGIDRPALVRAACDCARTALKYVPAGEDRPRLAIEAAERWADDPTRENRNAARDAYCAAYDAGSIAQDSACAAAHAVAVAAGAFGYAAGAAVFAASAASVADDAGALKNMAALVRARITWEMIKDKI